MPDTSEKLAQWENELEDIRHERSQLNARERRVKTQIDETNSRLRPVYPTQAQMDGIARAAEMIRAKTAHGDHHADAVDDSGLVHYCSRQNRINLYAHSPYAKLGSGRLWEFEPAEIDMLTLLVEANGLKIIDTWDHDDGFGLHVSPTV